MSMSTHIYGIIPPDDKWLKMKAVWDACEAAGVACPAHVLKFFNDEPPDDSGVVIDIEDHHSVGEYSEDSSSGFEVDIRELPKDVQIVRFVNSW